jgi:hypothetical protein
MARLYAQLFSLVFLVVGVGGLLVTGLHGGELGSLGVHLTWLRDATDCAVLAVLVAVGFVLDRRPGRILTGVVGLLLLVRGIAGFIVGTRTVAELDFSVAVDVLDVVAGLLGVLAALGTIEDETLAG